MLARTGMVGLYTDARHIIAYGDGEVRRQFNICLTARLVGGALTISDESTDVRWVSLGEIDTLSMHDSQRLRIGHFLDQTASPYIG